MGKKLVMGYWDCTYCGTKGIKGTERNCPNCGTPRDKDIKFYLKEGPVEYLTEEQSKTKGKGQDWLCSSCGALNSTLVNICPSCGNPRDESDKGYFENRRKEEAKKAAPPPPVKPRRSLGKRQIILGIIAAIVIAIVGAGIIDALPKSIDITDMWWESTQEIERYQECYENDWSLPEGAKLDYKQKEIHHYDQVLDHYETETYESYEVIGSHTEYRYEDQGDGTYEEVPYSVSDYGYVTRTREVPVYRDVPVYKTKYYYYIWRWKYEREVNATAHDKSPYYEKTELKKNERKGDKRTIYYVKAVRKDKEKEYKTSKDIYMQLETGTTVKVRTSGKKITELK